MKQFFRNSLKTKHSAAVGALLLLAIVAIDPAARALAADNPLVLRLSTRGNDVAYATLPDRSGNFYVAGLIDDPAAASTYGIAKFSAQGDLLWRSSYEGGTTRNGAVRHLTLDAEGNIIATGSIQSAATKDGDVRQEVLTVKFSSEGKQLWARRYGASTHGDAVGMRVAVDGRGVIFVAGSSMQNSTDWLLLKYGAFGDLLAERVRDSAARGDDRIVDMQLAGDGSIAIAGYTAYGAPTGLQTVIAKFDTNLRELWSRHYLASGHRDSVPVDLIVDATQAILVTGLTAANLHGAEEAVVPYAVKLGGDGSLRVELNGAGAGGAAVDVERSGDFVLAGAISRDARSPELAGALASSVSKYDPQGNRLWTVAIGDAGTFEVATARIADSGTVFVAGTVRESRASHYVLLKLSADGKTLWEHRFGGTTSAGHATDLALNGGRTLLLGQYSSGEGYDLVALLYGELAPTGVRRGRFTTAE